MSLCHYAPGLILKGVGIEVLLPEIAAVAFAILLLGISISRFLAQPH